MSEVIVLTDEEFYEMKKREKRKSFFDDLENISKSSKKNKSFSVKSIREAEVESTKEESVSDIINQPILSKEDSEDDWGDFTTNLFQYQMSPIESITDDNISEFRLDTDIVESNDNKYGNVFKKELAMLSEVLKDIKAHGTRVDNALKKMNIGTKGSSSRATGIPKGYSDLVEAYNSINTTKISVIKAMSDLRSKQIDWQFKDKANGPEIDESADSLVDAYYKRLVGGASAKNIQSNLSNMYQNDTNFDYDNVIDDTDFSYSKNFNITQPINATNEYKDSDDIIGDEFGYIRNENTNYETVVYQYGDNKFQFAVLDDTGEPIEDMEVPSDVDPDILESLSIRPGSDFVYDKYGRSYRVIEMGNVDISDVDDMDYPY
jgi:hypothetical protein